VTIDLRNADMALFEAYEDKVLRLLDRYGGRIEMRVRAIDQSSETHLLYMPDARAFEGYRSDPEREAAQEDWRRCRASSTAKEVEVIPSAVKS
jgi:hypothetical protein